MSKSDLKLGAHTSAAGGYHKSVERTADIGGNIMQLFSSSPRTWASANPSDDDIQTFLDTRQKRGIGDAYFHACYLINLADRGVTGEKSVKSLIDELNIAKKVNVIGSVVHTGTYKTDDEKPEDEEHYEHLISQIQEVLDNSPKETLLLLENAGNRKIGKDIDQLARIIKDVDDDRVRVCLDTCHLHAAGYDISTEEKFEDFFSRFDEMIGLDKLELIHVNDSRDELGALRDRHANIGEGKIADGTFELLLNRPETRDKPFIIETPGFGGGGPDEENMNILKDMRE